MTKLADFMCRDPFEKSVELDITAPDDPLRIAFGRLGLLEPERPLVVTPAKRSKAVIDARADATCSKCGQLVWMAPSSHRSRDSWTCIVCLECLEKVMGLPPHE